MREIENENTANDYVKDLEKELNKFYTQLYDETY